MNLTGFNFLADAAYDSSDLYDFVHLESESTAFIPLRASSKKPLVGDCGKPLSLHSHYRETKRNILRNKYVCDDPSNCPLNKYNCYAYRNFSKDDFRSFLNRDASSFKKVYKKRTLIESIFSKLADMTNSTSLRCKNSVEVECNLSNL
ncbi:MAG: transposase, partial [Defluviitoga sp.]